MRDNTKKRILDVSRQLFIANGLSKTRVEDIVEHAGISRATFYNYFHSKDEVTFYVVGSELEKLSERMRRAIQEEPDPYQKLKKFFILEIHGIDEMNRLMCLRMDESETLPAIPKKLVLAKIERDLDIIMEILAYGVQAGLFEVDDPRLTAQIILNTLGIYLGPFSTEKVNLQTIESDVDRIFKVLCFGFLKGGRKGSDKLRDGVGLVPR